MRTLAITAIIAFMATGTLSPGPAEAACMADDLGCSVHGGSGLVFDRGGFVPRTGNVAGSRYIDRATRAATSPQAGERYRQRTPDRDTRLQTDWDDLSGWDEFDRRMGNSRRMPDSSDLTGDDNLEDDEAAPQLQGNHELTRQRSAQPGQRAPARAAPARKAPASGPSGYADSPQKAASSFFNAQ